MVVQIQLTEKMFENRDKQQVFNMEVSMPLMVTYEFVALQ